MYEVLRFYFVTITLYANDWLKKRLTFVNLLYFTSKVTFFAFSKFIFKMRAK